MEAGYGRHVMQRGASRSGARSAQHYAKPLAAVRISGFTLLEILVVLLIAGMVMTILMQWLHQTYRLQQHFGHEIFNSQQGEMYAEWFRQSVNGAMPDTSTGSNRFKGDARQFSGLTLSPVDSAVQAMMPFVWRIRFNPETGRTQLIYGQEETAPEIASWTGNTGRFAYIGQDGQISEMWPPPFAQSAQLPKVILLQTQQKDMPRVIVAVPRGLQSPLPRRADIRD